MLNHLPGVSLSCASMYVFPWWFLRVPTAKQSASITAHATKNISMKSRLLRCRSRRDMVVVVVAAVVVVVSGVVSSVISSRFTRSEVLTLRTSPKNAINKEKSRSQPVALAALICKIARS